MRLILLDVLLCAYFISQSSSPNVLMFERRIRRQVLGKEITVSSQYSPNAFIFVRQLLLLRIF